MRAHSGAAAREKFKGVLGDSRQTRVTWCVFIVQTMIIATNGFRQIAEYPDEAGGLMLVKGYPCSDAFYDRGSTFISASMFSE